MYTLLYRPCKNIYTLIHALILFVKVLQGVGAKYGLGFWRIRNPKIYYQALKVQNIRSKFMNLEFVIFTFEAYSKAVAA